MMIIIGIKTWLHVAAVQEVALAQMLADEDDSDKVYMCVCMHLQMYYRV